VIAGWAVAQSPRLLPGLTIRQAAAGHTTLVALVIAVAGGALILGPSLALLFKLTLAGRFDVARATVAQRSRTRRPAAHLPTRLAAAGALLVVGAVCTVLLESWGLALGVVSLLAFVLVAFTPLATPPEGER
jgi:cytochrome bd ubiquinol oxidase subunit II